VDLGVLLTLPVESIAIRAIVAAVLSVIAVRLLLRTGLRAPGCGSRPRWSRRWRWSASSC
jgi:hypothetical protein